MCAASPAAATPFRPMGKAWGGSVRGPYVDVAREGREDSLWVEAEKAGRWGCWWNALEASVLPGGRRGVFPFRFFSLAPLLGSSSSACDGLHSPPSAYTNLLAPLRLSRSLPLGHPS